MASMARRYFQLPPNQPSPCAKLASTNAARTNATMNDRAFGQPLIHDSISAAGSNGLILPAAMLFDMDGTLTAPFLDFDQIKTEMGIGNQPILEALSKLDGPQREHAQAVLHRHEDRCARECEL